MTFCNMYWIWSLKVEFRITFPICLSFHLFLCLSLSVRVFVCVRESFFTWLHKAETGFQLLIFRDAACAVGVKRTVGGRLCSPPSSMITLLYLKAPLTSITALAMSSISLHRPCLKGSFLYFFFFFFFWRYYLYNQSFATLMCTHCRFLDCWRKLEFMAETLTSTRRTRKLQSPMRIG